MSKKPRAKKARNANKLTEVFYKKERTEILKSSAIYQLPGGKCEFLSLEDKAFSSKSLQRVYIDEPHKWSVMIIVFKVLESGAKAIDVEHLTPPFSVYADQISDSVEARHDIMINKCDAKEFLCPAWIAMPRDEIMSTVKIHELFEKLGVWKDYVTDNGHVLFEER